MNRIILQNLWIKERETYVLINLLSFRRERLTYQQFLIFQSIEKKLTIKEPFTEDEEALYKCLMSNKQILNDDTILLAENLIKKNDKISKDNNIIFNLSYKCNFNCNYCYQKNFKTDKQLSIEDIERVFSLFKFKSVHEKKSDVCKEVIISGGEPLMSNSIPIINRIVNLFNKSKLSLYTNGVNIKKYWNDIPFRKFNKIQITIDGTQSIIDIVNRPKEKIDFKELIDSIINLSQYGNEIVIVTMLTKETVQEYDNLIMELQKNNILNYTNIYFKIIVPVDFTNENTIDEELYSLQEYCVLIQQLRQKTHNQKIFLSTIPELSFLSFLLRRDKHDVDQLVSACKHKNGNPCVISPDGKIYWCTCLESEANCIGEFRPKLYLDNEKIKNIMGRSIFTLEKCKKCNFKFICGAGCPLYNFKNNIDINVPFCGVLKNDFVLENLEYFI